MSDRGVSGSTIAFQTIGVGSNPSGRSKGWVSEWLKELVLKTSEPKGSVGSNPTPSANLKGRI